MDAFELAKPTFLESWPEELQDMSMDQEMLPLSDHEARALGSNIAGYAEAFGFVDGRAMLHLIDRVRESVQKFPTGTFLRLGSRSPKDSWLGHREGFRVSYIDADQLRFFRYTSHNMVADLQAALAHSHGPNLFVREWRKLEPYLEFRCFMFERELVGVSQYRFSQYFPELETLKELIRVAIAGFFKNFKRVCHMDTVVFDIGMGRDRKNHLKPILVDLNPWCPDPAPDTNSDGLTDPGLFSWAEQDFDGTIRYAAKP